MVLDRRQGCSCRGRAHSEKQASQRSFADDACVSLVHPWRLPPEAHLLKTVNRRRRGLLGRCCNVCKQGLQVWHVVRMHAAGECVGSVVPRAVVRDKSQSAIACISAPGSHQQVQWQDGSMSRMVVEPLRPPIEATRASVAAQIAPRPLSIIRGRQLRPAYRRSSVGRHRPGTTPVRNRRKIFSPGAWRHSARTAV